MQQFNSWSDSDLIKHEVATRKPREEALSHEEKLKRDRDRAAARRQQEFLPMSAHFQDAYGTQVCYGQLRWIAERLLATLPTADHRMLLSEGIPILTPWGKVCLRVYKEGSQVTGGELWYQLTSNPKRTNHIFDVRPFFMQSREKTATLYGTDNASAIMKQARLELADVGLRAYQNRWFRNSSIADFLFHEMKIDLDRIPIVNHNLYPATEASSVACGYLPGPIHEFDMVSAYASSMLEFPQLGDFAQALDAARKSLEGKPTARVLKVTQSVLPGKFLSPKLPTFRPDLGTYIRGNTRALLIQAMERAVAAYGTVYRWNTDGFFTNVDISRQLDIGDNLGQWKHTVHDYLLIAQTNVFKTNLKSRDCGYNIDWDAVRENPLLIHTSMPTTDWTTFTEHNAPRVLKFDGGYHNCEHDGYGCHGEYHYKREAWDQLW
jgi:hypothetical protein